MDAEGAELQPGGGSPLLVEQTPSASSLESRGGVTGSTVGRNPTGAGSNPALGTTSSLCQEGMQLLYWGLRIKGATDDWRWAVGDLILRMEEVYNESAYQFLEPLKDAFGYDALRQYRMVAAGVPAATRVTELSWSHHRVVARLPQAVQLDALSEAVERELSVREFTLLVEGKQEYTRPIVTLRCPECGYAAAREAFRA